MYQNEPPKHRNNAPISIIITTLSAHAYRGELSVVEAIKGILKTMHNFIEVRNGEYWIENPAMEDENFAEKWNDDADKQAQFMRWLKQANEDILIAPLNEHGIHKVSAALEHSFGSSIVKKSVSNLGSETKKSRDDGNLYIAGLSGGLKTTADNTTKKIGGHTFFGK